MSKIDEIIQKHIDPHRFLIAGSYEVFEDAMKEYAEWYAKKCLEIAEDKLLEDDRKDVSYVNRTNPTNIKLPDKNNWTDSKVKNFAREFAEIKIKEFIKEVEECLFIDLEYESIQDEYPLPISMKITNVQLVIDKILNK